MASVRTLKKVILLCTNDVIDDSGLFMCITKDKNKIEEAYKIVEKAVDLRDQLIGRANHPAGKNDRKLVKQHYAAIWNDLEVNVNKLFDELSLLAK